MFASAARRAMDGMVFSSGARRHFLCHLGAAWDHLSGFRVDFDIAFFSGAARATVLIPALGAGPALCRHALSAALPSTAPPTARIRRTGGGLSTGGFPSTVGRDAKGADGAVPVVDLAYTKPPPR